MLSQMVRKLLLPTCCPFAHFYVTSFQEAEVASNLQRKRPYYLTVLSLRPSASVVGPEGCVGMGLEVRLGF